ncbi:hypothetical protein AMTR_s00049p00217230 [Amborella trichopoda]|uniref:DUF659 domain-containing protein n=1 Tax=Amborella trichopoda TaxID=13333 RepID=W1Q0X2_AMBTC|nr:hypothetical protein AMTR_s00049p00217230 [Amborella trichopoda]
MVSAIQRVGPKVKPPTAYELSALILDEEAEEVTKQQVDDKRKHLVWTPCAANSIDLMLEEIGEIKIVKETLEEARLVSRFIYNHFKILFLFREHSKKKEIIRLAITRFATDYLAVDSIRESEYALRRLFICEEWLNAASQSPVPV